MSAARSNRRSLNGNSKITQTGAGIANVLIGGTGTPHLQMDSNASIEGKVEINATVPVVTALGSTTIGGAPASLAIANGNAIGGQSPPEFPAPDTDVFKPFATNALTLVGAKYSSGTLQNVIIKANTNPTFENTVEGVIYVETPNKVTFDSNAVVRGVIAVQNNPTGTYMSNQLIFKSNATITGVGALNPAVFGNLVDLDGAVIIAPKYMVTMDSNFGTTGGSIIAGKIMMNGNATGIVDGSLVALDNTPATMNGNAEIQLTDLGIVKPSGVRFSGNYEAIVDSYEEVHP